MIITPLDGATIRSLLAKWLREVEEPPLFGLEPDEALNQARELLPAIIAGRITPTREAFDAEFKDVLYAMVDLLESGQIEFGVTLAAHAVYRYIRGVHWPNDLFGERAELLRGCLAAARNNAANQGVASSEREPAEIFDQALPAIREIFALSESSADTTHGELEADLRTWFLRFAKRPNAPAPKLEAILLAAAAQFAREARRFRGSAELIPAAD